MTGKVKEKKEKRVHVGGAVPVHMCLSAAIIRQLNELLSKAEQEAAVMQERRPPASLRPI